MRTIYFALEGEAMETTAKKTGKPPSSRWKAEGLPAISQ
jgi:hypothetical protein